MAVEDATFTEVATNAIWRETIKREQASAKLRTNFSVPDPSRSEQSTSAPLLRCITTFCVGLQCRQMSPSIQTAQEALYATFFFFPSSRSPSGAGETEQNHTADIRCAVACLRLSCRLSSDDRTICARRP